MNYDFKLIPEAVRAGVFGIAVYGAQLLVGFDWGAAQDWETYLRSAGAGAVTAAGAASLAVLTRKKA